MSVSEAIRIIPNEHNTRILTTELFGEVVLEWTTAGGAVHRDSLECAFTRKLDEAQLMGRECFGKIGGSLASHLEENWNPYLDHFLRLAAEMGIRGCFLPAK
jgi:hypothetical protein